MYQKICLKTSDSILSVLAAEIEVHENAICYPQEYFASIQRMLSGILGIVTCQNLKQQYFHSVVYVFQELEESLGSKCLFIEKFKETSKSEQKALNKFYHWYQTQKFRSVNVSHVYELMLGLEFPIENGTITEDHGGKILDTIGSFYTPYNLADKIVQLTLDNYIFENTGIERFSGSENSEIKISQVSELLITSSFADHCCGTGSLLLAILRYVEQYLGLDTFQIQEQIVLNFVAIEADALALEVAKIQILTYMERLELYPILSEKFIHRNLILHPMNMDSSFSYSDEFYYHNALTMRPSDIKKCDVIVGNPPWGEVDFDLAFFCHIILPKVSEVETQVELEQVLGGLETSHNQLFKWILEHEEANDQAVNQIYEDGRFQFSTTGGLHTNVIFTELLNTLSTSRGSVGLVLKGSTLTDKNNAGLLKKLNSENRIVGRFDFKNINKIFNIDSDEDFSILILGSRNKNKSVYLKGLTSLNMVH